MILLWVIFFVLTYAAGAGISYRFLGRKDPLNIIFRLGHSSYCTITANYYSCNYSRNSAIACHEAKRYSSIVWPFVWSYIFVAYLVYYVVVMPLTHIFYYAIGVPIKYMFRASAGLISNDISNDKI